MTAAVSDETDDERTGVPGIKHSHQFRIREASNPNDWLRTSLVAVEIYRWASMRRKIELNSAGIR
jgi:hypothetical protein